MDTKKYVKEGELSERLRAQGIDLDARWLQADRQGKRLIPFIKISRQVWYDTDKVFATIDEIFTVGGNRQPGVKVPKTVRKVATVKRGGE